jgi:hypothetical protein
MRSFGMRGVAVTAFLTSFGLVLPVPAAAVPLAGDELWVSRQDGTANGSDEALATAISPDGSLVFVTGYSDILEGIGTDDAYMTVAYETATGEQRWLRRYDGPASGYDFGQEIAIGPGDELYITGYRDGVDSGPDYATISYDGATGHRRWVRRYDGPAHDSDTARAVAVSPEGSGVFVTGWSFGVDSADFPFDILTVAYDGADGHRRWVQRYNGPSNGSDGGNDLVVGPDGSSVYVAGFSDRAGQGRTSTTSPPRTPTTSQARTLRSLPHRSKGIFLRGAFSKPPWPGHSGPYWVGTFAWHRGVRRAIRSAVGRYWECLMALGAGARGRSCTCMQRPEAGSLHTALRSSSGSSNGLQSL